jgi:acyl-CoA reductase-like NAD-dependent aldehyde dehydrogenase
VVFNDADVEAAVNGVAFACFVASGQTCVSGTRLIVQNGIYDEFMARFLHKVASIRRRMGGREPFPCGPCHFKLTGSAASNPQSTMGTIISPSHLDRISKMVSQYGNDGVLLAGGERLSGMSELDGFDFSRGSFYPPTVIGDVHLESQLWKEELFGPVVVVRPSAKRIGQICPQEG